MTEQNTTGLPAELCGEFTILSELKSDKRGQVLLIYDRICRRKAVLKTASGNPGFPESEAAAMTACAGEGVPVIYSLFSAEDGGWLLREYVAGNTLEEYVKSKGTLSDTEVIALGAEVCRIVSRLHSHVPPYIHRDIKPQNIVRRDDGTLCFIDFGTCRVYDSSASTDTQIIGTPAVAPPEQFGFQQTDTRSDVYSIGMLLNFLSTGEFSTDNKKLSPRLKPVIEKCTSFAPENRYSNAGELLTALEKRMPGSAARRRRAFIAVFAAAAAALALVVPAAISLGRDSAPVSESGESTAYQFADPTIEKEVCRQLRKDVVTEDDLKEITELMLIGGTPFDKWDGLFFCGSDISLHNVTMYDKGKISTLEDIAAMPNLHTLALCNHQIADLSPLEGSRIERLALHGNNISDITPLSGCSSLRELHISGNPVSIFSPLLDCRLLTHLNVGDTNIKDLDEISQMDELISLNITFCEYLSDVSPLSGMDGLRELEIFPASADTLDIICGMKNLTSLLIWLSDSIPDFSRIAELQNLNYLLIDPLDNITISSLDGIEKMKNLTNLHVCNAVCADVSAICKSPSLSCVEFLECEIDDFSALRYAEKINSIGCDAEDYEKIAEALDEKVGVTVTIL